MYSAIAALTLLGFALAWTVLNRAGSNSFDLYISLIAIGLAYVTFWFRPRRIICPPLPNWLTWLIRGVLLYLVFQAIPLPMPILALLSPARAELTRALTPIAGPVTFAPISIDPAAHVRWLLTIAASTAVFFLVRNVTFRLQNRLFAAFLPVVLVAALEAALGLLQIAGGAQQATGSYNNRDHYCCILELTLPVTVAFGLLFFAQRSELPTLLPVLKAIACWLIATLLTLGILFSLSRAGWIDSVLALLLLSIFILFPRTRSQGWRLGIFAALLLLVFAIFLAASPGEMITRLASTMTTNGEGRIYIWRQLVPLTRDFRWFGAGLLGFGPAFLKYQDFVNSKTIEFAHNDFLQYLIEMGLIGFAVLMTSLAGIIWPIARASWLSRSDKRVLLAGCLAGLFAMFVHSLVDFNLYVSPNMLTFAWILGFGSSLSAFARTQTSGTTPEALR
jgi:O-antigen ligase